MAEQYPKTIVCRVLGVARSSHYYTPQAPDESALKSVISEVCARYPRYGYRRVTAELHRRRWLVNRKRVARLMAEMGLQAKKVARKRRTTNSNHAFPRFPNLVQDLMVQRPDQILGSRHHLHSTKEWFCVSGCFDGCVYSCHSRLAFEPFPRSEFDPGSLTQSLRNTFIAHKSITPTKVCSTQPANTLNFYTHKAFGSAWQKWANPPRTAMPSVSCAPSKKRRLTYPTTKTIITLTSKSASSLRRSTCVSKFIHP